MFSGKKSSDRGEDGEDGGAQRYPRNPSLATVLGAVMDLFVQMFEWNFRFFHRSSLRSTLMRSRRNRQVGRVRLYSTSNHHERTQKCQSCLPDLPEAEISK